MAEAKYTQAQALAIHLRNTTNGTKDKLKLMKLLYFAQEFWFAEHETPLFEDEIQAWDLGPVVPSVYHKWDELINLEARIRPDNQLNPEVIYFLNILNEFFAPSTPSNMVNLTHRSNTPWSLYFKRGERNIVIPPDEIRRFVRAGTDNVYQQFKFWKRIQEEYPLLAPYFRGLTVEMLLRIPLENLCAQVPEQLRLLMLSFYLNLFPKLMAQSNQSTDADLMETTPLVVNADGCLDLSGSVLGNSVAQMVVPGSIPLSNLSAQISDADKVRIASLDLSDCDLEDDDASLVVQFVSSCTNVRIVKLANNAFCKCDQSMTTLLQSPRIEFVNLIGNPIATVNRADFLTTLASEHLSKLIWIPQSWLDSEGWKQKVIKNENMHHVVIESHQRYFKQDVKK